jgi:hypothetical protein
MNISSTIIITDSPTAMRAADDQGGGDRGEGVEAEDHVQGEGVSRDAAPPRRGR